VVFFGPENGMEIWKFPKMEVPIHPIQTIFGNFAIETVTWGSDFKKTPTDGNGWQPTLKCEPERALSPA